ncbi:MAG: Signal transduction histidine kinase [Candidatus Carbobacillus altaicus]|uniref:Signal transduction histidine kinase n=1 Tax=Candidatus Carbonibacillus altaicus TaxID=2163959 RepID=A0A2R6XXZ1_9BACL|nr:MAG: Signal transduction histidine kinase [Candidatus Carbobacillus altaicus]
MRWLLLLEADDHEEIRKELEAIAMKDPVMKQAFEEWEDMSRDMKKWVEYESRRKAILDEMAAVIEARDRGFAEGRAEGQAVGREEGRAEGRAEGLAEGERQKAIEIAKEMLAEGDSVERVARLTKLSLEEVEKLKQQLH